MYVKDKTSFSYVNKSHPNAIRLVQQMNHSNGIVGYVDKKKLPDKFKNKIEKAGKISINPDQPLSYYQDKEFIGNSVIIIDTSELSRNSCLYIVSELQRIRNGSTWNQKFPKSEVINAEISLPVQNGEIDFEFMDTFIAELEAERIAELEAERIAELSAYLKVSGLDNYELSDEELKALRDYDSIDFEEFEYQEVFDKIVQGRRLKKDDQIPGDIPFVMSGVTNTGIVNFISNPVASFPRNSITLDIFGNAFYRPYAYGAGDDTGVYWNEENEYSKEVMLYITSSMSRSVAGKYDYGNKLRSSKSKNIKMKLPAVSKGVLDTDYMRIITNAVMKLAIKDVVQYTNERIETTKEVVTSHNTNY